MRAVACAWLALGPGVLAAPTVVAALPIVRIEVVGSNARPEAVLALLDARVGLEFDARLWAEDLRRLRNSDLFYLVQGEVVTEGFAIRGNELVAEIEIAHAAIGSDFDFVRGVVSWVGAARPHHDWNLAAQALIGSKSGSEFQRKFYLGGLDTTGASRTASSGAITCGW